MTGLIWLTNVETAETIGVPLSKVLLIEQKRPQDGGAVALYLDHGKEVQVSESLSRIKDFIAAADGASALPERPSVTLAAG
ncbi:MAG: hypothetical protein AAFU55_03295 [Pseudomonadota bacterium]